MKKFLALTVFLFLISTASAQAQCTLLETVNVGAQDSDGADSVNTLTNGGQYLLTARGTFVPTSLTGAYADAEYLTLNNWATLDRVAGGFDVPEGVHDLLVDNTQVNWGVYVNSHTYTIPYTGAGAKVNLQIDDWYIDTGDPWDCHDNYPQCMNDNSGSLDVDIYTCNPEHNLPEFVTMGIPLLILILAPGMAYVLVRKRRS